MTLDQICVTKEWAEKLKEAGYPQESLHWWGGIGNMGIWCDHVKDDLPTGEKRFTWFAAPTASEILEKLPSFIVLDTNKTWLSCSKNIFNLFEVGYATNVGFINGHMEEKSLANALAKMYCYLVQENLTKKD